MFSVFTRDRLGQYQGLWRTENQSDWSGTLGEWIPVQVDLKAPYSVQVNMNMSHVSKLYKGVAISPRHGVKYRHFGMFLGVHPDA